MAQNNGVIVYSESLYWKRTVIQCYAAFFEKCDEDETNDFHHDQTFYIREMEVEKRTLVSGKDRREVPSAFICSLPWEHECFVVDVNIRAPLGMYTQRTLNLFEYDHNSNLCLLPSLHSHT